MRRKIYSLITAAMLLAGLSVFGLAQGETVTLTGHIIDKACSQRSDIAGHKRSCAVSENCAKSGFGVYADGKFYEFDEKGNEMALAKLKASSKDAGAKFKVEGSIAEMKLMVKSISEVE
ncbi:MAG: hypothetical protein KF868_15540 [Acidobacteria bacterium]|nr:hypothetical protein [Acidobacteriota bacterium]MCW5968359.1 hypothetical protein [Blastocatellales bacterium]